MTSTERFGVRGFLEHIGSIAPPRDSSAPDLDDLVAVVSASVASGHLPDVLRAVRTEAARSTAVTEECTWHPLGFAKLVLGHLPGTSVRLRLHIWDDRAGADEPQNDPHSHCWRFASVVVGGGPLEVVHFEERADGTEFRRLEYRPARGEMVPSGTRRLGVVETMRRGRDTPYRCDHGTVHTIAPVDPSIVTTTLIAQGPEVASSTPVYRDRDGSEITGRQRVTPEQLRRLVTGALAQA